MPGIERMANIIDTIVDRDFIADAPPASWRMVLVAAVLLLAALAGVPTAFMPTALCGTCRGRADCGLGFAAAQLAFAHHFWLPLVAPAAALATAMAAVLLFRYWVVDRDGRLVRSAFRHYLAPGDGQTPGRASRALAARRRDARR